MVKLSRWAILSLILSGVGLALGMSYLSQQNSSHAESLSLDKSQSSSSKPSSLSIEQTMPSYDHIFVVVAENKAYEEIIGSVDAPQLNRLAQAYGLATQFYGEVHPSEANYIAMLGGDTFGIHDDDAYYCNLGSADPFCPNAKEPGYVSHTISAPNLMTQLEKRGLSWKGYFEDLPSPGADAVVAPSPQRALYASKHNGFMNFKSVQSDPKRAQKIVGLDQFIKDLSSNQAPNYSHIILNQCHEMHGLAECLNPQALIRDGDKAIAALIQKIMASPLWASSKNNAIIVTWDEDDHTANGPQGCCGFDPKSAANFGGGHIATLVITNHGARKVVDKTPYNHYSLLRTVEAAFGIQEYLGHAKDSDVGIKSMTPLFRVAKSAGQKLEKM